MNKINIICIYKLTEEMKQKNICIKESVISQIIKVNSDFGYYTLHCGRLGQVSWSNLCFDCQVKSALKNTLNNGLPVLEHQSSTGSLLENAVASDRSCCETCLFSLALKVVFIERF